MTARFSLIQELRAVIDRAFRRALLTWVQGERVKLRTVVRRRCLRRCTLSCGCRGLLRSWSRRTSTPAAATTGSTHERDVLLAVEHVGDRCAHPARLPGRDVEKLLTLVC